MPRPLGGLRRCNRAAPRLSAAALLGYCGSPPGRGRPPPGDPIAMPLPPPLGDRIVAEWAARELRELLCQAVHRDRAETIPVGEDQRASAGPAEGMRLLQDRVEHRGEIAR